MEEIGLALLNFALLGALFVLLRLLLMGSTRAALTRRFRRELATNTGFYFLDAVFVLPTVLAVTAGCASVLSWAGWAGALGELIPGSLPDPALFILVVVISDLAGYWRHRLLHTGVFWPTHAVHHRDTEVHWLTLVRIHPLERWINAGIDTFILGLFGFGLEFIVANNLLRHYYGFFLHSEVSWDYGWARYLFVSPRLHRWHHSDSPDASGKNLAVIFAWIDVVFGTYYAPRNKVPETFGTAPGQPLEGLVGALIAPFRDWAAGLRPLLRTRIPQGNLRRSSGIVRPEA